MKKIGCLLFALTLSNLALAANNASLVLSGYVDEICLLEIDPVVNASIDIDITSAVAALTVATFNVEHNFAGGYTLSVASANSGDLVHENGAGDGTVTYTLDWDVTTDVVNAAQPFVSDATGGYQNVTGNINLNIATGATNPTAGLYSDELTFTMAAL